MKTPTLIFLLSRPGNRSPRSWARVGAGALLALTLASPSEAQNTPGDHRGGTLRLLSRAPAGSIDPHLNYTQQYWQIFTITHDGLVAFRKVPGQAGLEIVPDLAESVTQDGLKYRFTLRQGIRFSNGSPVTPQDVVASIQRIFTVGSPTANSFYGAIDGAAACLATPGPCTLPGVQAEGQTVTITLTRPDAEFLTTLALPHAAILPASAPQTDTGTTPLPGTGPYQIVTYDPNDRLVLTRNPHFREWSHDAQPDGYPDRIDYQFGLEDEAELTAIQNGQADWMFDSPPADRLRELSDGRAAIHINPTFALWFAPLNVHVAPFDDPRVRRALNLAIDRRAPAKLYGGAELASPTCQILPPGLLGYVPYCPYAPDLPQARALVAASGTAGQRVTVVTDDSPTARVIGTYLLDVLGDLGFVARLRTLSGAVQFNYIQNSANEVQISLTTWYADYPSPTNFLSGVFGCAAFRPNSSASPNISGFCDPALDAALAVAVAADDADGIAAVDRAMTDAAPAIPLFNPRSIDVVSRRVGHFVFHEEFRWLIGQAWVN